MNEALSSESFLKPIQNLPELCGAGVALGADFEAEPVTSGVEPGVVPGVVPIVDPEGKTIRESGATQEIESAAQPQAEQPQHNWLTAAAIAAYDTVRNHPVEFTGGALLALAAYRFRGVLAEGAVSLADDAARLLGKKSLPQMGGHAGTATETAATNALVKSGNAISVMARDGISPSAPWVMRNGVKQPVDLQDILRTGHFDNLIPKQLPPGSIAIPTVSREFLKKGAIEYPAPAVSIEREFGQRGFLYRSFKDSTIQVLGTKDGGGGTAFFLRENGIAATANHVVDKFKDGSFRVLMSNGEVLPARLLARDRSKDLALFHVDGLQYVRAFEFAPARSLQPGVRAHIIGNPSGVPEKVMNSGRIEGFKQVVRDGDTPYLGISHSIDTLGGSSGSPLIIDSGKAAGMHIWGRHGRAHGEAVAIRHFRPMLDDLTRRTMVHGFSGLKGIDEWRTSVVLSENALKMPKTEVLGRKLFTQ
ncbi:MAG: trypsin-like peptidase domain-containing protein [Candidatus Melainabacteria bacterium]|jgi:S1-C subfamily serine protease|nr:trypsin-like peptidase domain-containing protein [Candidatus Melainabacteria bacterium]